ncbi:MAG: FHA domain-containing protein [Pseudomonadota bacterium]
MIEERGSLIVMSPRGNERVYALSDGTVLIGRSAECDIILRDPQASRKHARLEISAEQIAVYDLNSRSGVTVDGADIEQATLGDGSVIRLAGYELKLELPKPVDAATAAADEYIEIAAGLDEPSIVETVRPGEATVTHAGLDQSLQDTSHARLAVYEGGAPYEIVLTADKLIIGRDEQCDVPITDTSSSRQHAMLERHGERYVLRDLDSKNGTWIRNRRITESKLFGGTNFRIGDTLFVYKAPFRHEALTLDGARDPGFEAEERMPVVVLPGIMGSELHGSDGLVWPNLAKTFRNPERLAIGADPDIKVGGIAREVIVIPGLIKLEAYSQLVYFLENSLGYKSGYDLLEFAYDWRQDNRDSAQKLKQAIDTWRDEVIGSNTKFVILCHSMGALVSRYYLTCLGGAANVEKFVTMGGAHFGSPSMIQTLLHGPDILPLGIGRKGFHETLITMPSGYQLIPPYPAVFDADGNAIDIHADTSWMNPDYRHLLESGREFHREIGTTVGVPTTCIFGYGVKTVTKIVVHERNADGWKKVRMMLKPAGDNRVLDQDGFLQGADIHPVRQQHGSLWTDNDVKMRLRIELMRNAVQ